MSDFASTPTFTLFRRGLEPRVVKRFHGINAYLPLTQLGPDWAQDLLNVIVNGNGQLSKFRIPQQLSNASGLAGGPQFIFDFQQANGTRQIFTSIGTTLAYFTNDGTIGPIIVSAASPLNANPWSFVEVANILIGVNGQKVVKWTGTDLLNVGIQQAVVAPTVVIVAGGLSPAFGYEWAYSYKCSGAAPNLAGPSPVEVGTASPATAQTDGGGVNHKYQLTATAPAPADPQFDTLVWWRTIDGGGDLFRLAEVNINTGVVTFNGATVTVLGAIPYLIIVDNTPDIVLDQTTRAPFLNAPPVAGKFAAVGQGRNFIANLPGAPQDIIYSGYERIIIGNPPECYPPNNRLRLAIGAEAIAGIGILQAGIVAFSSTDKMYMLRGQVEDITDTAPVQFTQYLVELPWKIGCFSHATIQATPYGLIWLAGDKTVQLFDGASSLQDLSSPVYPILRNITAGAEANCTSAYFNWLERDWYVLLVPYNGSITPNRMIMWGLNKDSASIDIFICTIPADGIGVVTSSQLQRRLLIGRTGQLFNLPVSSDTTGGIGNQAIIPPQVFTGAILDKAVSNNGNSNLVSVTANAIRGNEVAVLFVEAVAGVGAAPAPGAWTFLDAADGGAQSSMYSIVPFTGTATQGLSAPNNWATVLALFGSATGLPVGIVQKINFVSGAFGAGNQVATFAAPTGVGSGVIVVLYTHIITVGGLAPTVTDANGNIYTLVASTISGGASLFVFWSPNYPPSHPQMTFNLNVGFVSGSVEAYEVSGTAPVIALGTVQLPAYWFGGYNGNDSPQRSEMFRWARLITDQDPKAFQMRFNLVDDENSPITQPYQTPLTQMKSSKMAINRRAKRCAVLIQFPIQDVTANVMELQVMSVPSSDR